MRLIESSKFIESDVIEKLNELSAKEKTGGARPPYWEMVFWWTRKPLIGARAVIAASLLPADISIETFKNIVRLNAKRTPHRENPVTADYEDYFKAKKLLDPFAGFGSIPLEALRLGLDVTAVELLPAAYIFLKAVLDYPARYGEKLIDDVRYWGNRVTERLREDEDIKELYDDDVVVNIGTWEVKCPHCGKWTPLVGNWWLARVKASKGYKRLAFMKPVKNGNSIDIEVVDVKGDVSRAEVDTRTGRVKVGEPVYEVPKPNLNARSQQATCLNCGNLIRLVDSEGNHFMEGSNLEWFVKWALRKYHAGDERFARQRLLVKVKVNKDLAFEPCDEEDNGKLEKAKEKVKALIAGGEPDIPNEPISYYSVRYLFPILYGMTGWYKLFNPRQLLTLVKLVKLIREAGKRIEAEKIKEGLNEEDAFRYAEAVTSYLAIGLCKFADYNSACAAWNQSLIMGHTLSMRGIAMIWNHFEENPVINWTGSWYRNIEASSGYLSYIIPQFNTNKSSLTTETSGSKGKTKSILDDATTLSRMNDKFDIIVTDPPYADDVPYTELSDFYYVWLKRALSDSDGVQLTPRFHADAFFKRIGAKFVETKTQWLEFAKREISTNPGRFMEMPNRNEIAAKHFQELLTQSFIVMREKLEDEGLLVTYYAHTSPEAWANLLEAAWQSAGFHVKNAFPLATESAQRVTARGKIALDTSIVVVWKKESQEGRVEISKVYNEILAAAKLRAEKMVRIHNGRDVLIGTLSAALSVITSYREIYSPKGVLNVEYILNEFAFPLTALGIAMALSEKVKGKPVTSTESLFYLMVKVLFGGANKKGLDRSDVSLLKIATRADPNQLETMNIVKRGKEREYVLVEPSDASKFDSFLKGRGIDVREPKLRNAVDCLHLLEYYAYIYPRSRFVEKLKELDESLVEEAITLAKIVRTVEDSEAKFTDSVVRKYYGEVIG